MEVAINEKSVNNKIPAVGQPWHHKSSSEVYMRIDDIQGVRALDVNKEEFIDNFYSVSLFFGKIVHTSKKDKTIILLKPENKEINFNEI